MATTAFQTPQKEQTTAPLGVKLTDTEKRQLLENLDIEVDNEKRRFEAYLRDILESFATRHEAQITRIPKEVRVMTLREFDKYGGTVAACVQALCKQRIAAGEAIGLEKKRKWQTAIQEGVNQEEARHAKNPRLAQPSPLKPHVRPATNRTPMTNRTANKTLIRSAKKNRPKIEANHKQGRFASPTKSPAPSFRVPSTAFNPVLPKTPSYPKRIAKWNESVMSINGTPLAFPRRGAVDDDDAATVVSSERGSHVITRKEHIDDNASSRSSSSTAHSTSFTCPTITIPTTKGQVLQFDPISMSPGSFEKLPGLTNSAKKHAKDEMVRIVQNLAKWHI